MGQATGLKISSRLLVRGESAVAFIGISVAAILLATLASVAAWTMRTQKQAMLSSRQTEVTAVASSLAQSAEVMLASDGLSALRRLVGDAARNYDFGRCRITIGNNQVVADASPSKINVHKLPAHWSEGASEAATTINDQMIVMALPLVVSGRGGAVLEVSAPVKYPLLAYWETEAGLAGCGAIAMIALLIVYRKFRGRFRAIGAIREALLCLGNDKLPPAALVVSADLGPEAVAWNEMLAEQERLRRQSLAERAAELVGTRKGARSDLDAAFDAISQGLLLVDQGMTVRYVNGAAAVFLRVRREDMVGQNIEKLISEERIIEGVKSLVTGGNRRRLTIELERTEENEASGVLRFSIRPVRRDDSASAMIIIEDITQQRVAEESRHEFVAQATHELRAPLTNIRLYVETAIEDGDDVAVRTNCLNVINQEVRRLERIVGDMLSVAEIEAGSMKLRVDDVQLEPLLADLKGELLPHAQGKNISLNVNLPPKLPILHGDRDKIVLAIHNLVGNAIKYTRDGGKVDVNVQVEPKQLVINVADTGIGISDEDAQRIFEKFYRARDPRVGKITGSGLGLTLAREVTRLHGGDITVSSQVNKGSTFTLTLPLAEAA